MGFRIASDVAGRSLALQINRHSQSAIQSISALSSGRRITRPADDIPGVSVSMHFDKRVQSYQVVIQGVNEALSALQMADAKADDVVAILGRLRTLALQAANGTVDSAARVSLQNDAQAFLKQIRMTDQTTQFGDLNLAGTVPALPGPHATLSVVQTADAAVLARGDYKDLLQKLPNLIQLAFEKTYGMLGLLSPDGRTITVTLQGNAGEGSDGEAGVLATGGGAVFGNMTLTVDLADFLDLDNDGDKTVGYQDTPGAAFTPDMVLTHEVVHALSTALGDAGVGADAQWGGHVLSNFASEEVPYRITAGTEAAIQADVLNSNLSDGWPPGTGDDYAEAGLIGTFLHFFYGTDVFSRIISRVGAGSTYVSAILSETGYSSSASFGDAFRDWASTYFERDLWSSIRNEQRLTPFDRGYFNAQIGIGPSASEDMSASAAFSRVASLFYAVDVDLTTQTRAQRSLRSLDYAIQRFALSRATAGAGMDVLHNVVMNLESSFTGETGALSSVRDTDVAAAIAEFTKEQLLQNVANAAFTQMDQLRQSAVRILTGGA